MTPKDMLKKLQGELQDALAQADKATKLKAEVAALTKLIADQTAGESQYEKQYAAIMQDLTNKQAIAEVQVKAVADNTTAGDRTHVDRVVQNVQNKIDKLSAVLQSAAGDVDQAAAALAAKKAATASAQATLTALKEVWKRPQKALQDVAALLAAADQQLAAKNYPVVYYLLQEIAHRFDAAQMAKPDDYSKAVSDATEALFEATGAEQPAKDDLDQKTAAKTAAQKAYDDALAKRQDNIIKQINSTPPAPVPVPAPAPATPASSASS